MKIHLLLALKMLSSDFQRHDRVCSSVGRSAGRSVGRSVMLSCFGLLGAVSSRVRSCHVLTSCESSATKLLSFGLFGSPLAFAAAPEPPVGINREKIGSNRPIDRSNDRPTGRPTDI